MIKELPVFDASRRLVDDFELIVAGAMHFPNCVASIEHFRNVIGGDAEVDYSFQSEIGATIQASVRRRRVQGNAAGQVALRLLEMGVEPSISPSINKACRVVSAIVKDIEVDGRPYRPSTPDTVRQAFNKYRSSCHLWAATSVVPDEFNRAGQDRDAMLSFLKVAGVLQGALTQVIVDPRSPWDPWSIPLEFGDPEFSISIPGLTEEMKEILAHYVADKR